MKKIVIISAALVALGAGSAFAQGINLSWGDCGAAGATNLTWACNANLNATAAPKMFAVSSFVPPTDAVRPVVGLEVNLHWTSDQATLVPWWQFGVGTDEVTPGCRSNNMSPKFDATPLGGACTDYFGPLTPVGGGLTHWGAPNAASGTIKIQVAAPFDAATPLDGSTEYYGPFLQIDKLKTTGAGSCTGCASQVCMVLDDVNVFYADNTNVDLTNALNNNLISWQLPIAGVCPAATPTRARTWGELKSMYR